MQIAPSLLAADFTRLGEQIRDAEAAGADMLHVDVMDGHFVPNLSMGPMICEAAHRVTTLPLDVHLMVTHPDSMIDAFVQAGAATIHVHWETGFHIHRTLSKIRAAGCKAGIAINPHTPALVLTEVLPFVDTVVVMTINPGFGGQKLIPETLPKIQQIRALLNSQAREVDILVDGGVNAETIPQVVGAGANILVVGTGLFNHGFTVAEGMARLRAALTETQGTDDKS
ncbi:MAG: ribulose-phosphate 3-epimerase [Chloroflexota bacterium]|nr:ribulose-phosphate 3-epimerase [Chloroflexota bacterium]